MERLQIAIEKARANRQRASAGLPEPDPGKDATDGRADATDPASEQDACPPDVVWNALQEFTPNPKLLRRNLVVTTEPGNPAMPFDQLRTRIMQIARRNGWRRIAVVSTHAAAGKTTLCANLAFSFARQTDLRTIVLDFDLRRPGLAKILGQKPAHSMHEVISGAVPFADHAMRYHHNVAFGFNRGNARNASEILQSNDTSLLLDKLQQTYQPDFMLFDMPPVLITDDAIGFVDHVDAVLIVAEAGRTPIRQIDLVETQIAELTNVLGVVLNRCSFMDKDDGYYGDYY